MRAPAFDPEPGPALPAEIAREIERIRARVHRFLLADAAIAGTAAAVAVGLPVALGFDLAGVSPTPAAVLGMASGLVVAVREWKRRCLDGVRAAMILDRLLDAKDRFASAVQFAAAEDPPVVHRLQIRSAVEFLAVWVAEHGPVPQAPRPRWRSTRWLVAALVATGIAVPLHAALGSVLDTVHDSTRREPPPQSAEEIADRAEALRRRWERDPTRRIDQDINALEHALERAREREQRARAEALRRAAEAIERAAGIPPPADEREEEHVENRRAVRVEAADGIQDVSGTLPEEASERLRRAWEAAQRARQAWREAASQFGARPEQLAQLQIEAQRAQMEALRIAEQERNWRRAREEAEGAQQLETDREGRPDAIDRDGDGQPDAAQSDGEVVRDSVGSPARPVRDPGEALVRSIERLDRAIGALDRDDDDVGVPGPEVGRALERASGEIAEHTPETSRWLAEAARARAEVDAERMDRALEHAREALRREAGRESRELALARRRLQRLHDEVAERAGERAREQIAQRRTFGGEGEQDGNREPGPSGMSGPSGESAPAGGTGASAESGAFGPSGPRESSSLDSAAVPSTEAAQSAQSTQSGGFGPGDGAEPSGSAPAQGAGLSQGRGEGAGQEHAAGTGQGEPQDGTGAGQPQRSESGSGQGQSGGEGMSGEGSRAVQPGTGDGQGGDGMGSGDSPTRGWGTGVAGDPGLAAAQAAGASSEGVQVDPGTDPLQAGELSAEPDPLGLLPGAGRGPGRGRIRMDGIAGHPAREGNGVLGGSAHDGPRIGGGMRVPASLRAYVLRYLRALQQRATEGSSTIP